jgi:hypothetical protein
MIRIPALANRLIPILFWMTEASVKAWRLSRSVQFGVGKESQTVCVIKIR